MTAITFDGRRYGIRQGESVLDCLLRHGCEIPFSCKVGACRSCLMRAVLNTPPETAQRGLDRGLREQGYFHSCQWRPLSSTTVTLGDVEGSSVRASISAIADLGDYVKAVHLVPAEPFDCAPGQYVSLINPGGIARSYSIANLPAEDGCLTLHVGRVARGRMSGWIHDEARPGDRVHIRGPFGSCRYFASEGMRHGMLLAATGTGLAPLRGIVLDALARHHEGPIVLVHGGLRGKDLYCVDELRALASRIANLTYVPCVLHGTPPAGGRSGDIQRAVLELLPGVDDVDVYLCGAPSFVATAKKAVFLAGVPLRRIHSDMFFRTPAADPAVSRGGSQRSLRYDAS